MSLIALPAHFDGKKIQLDEPYQLKPNAKLIITILPEGIIEDEHKSWLSFSQEGISNAYGENEPEYTYNLIKEKNPTYEGR